jgi:hypothetical protein
MQLRCTRVALLAVAGLLVAADSLRAESPLGSLKSGTVELKSAGPLAFGPEGILFVGDPQAAAIHAIDTGDNKPANSADRPKVSAINEKIGALLGIEGKAIRIADMAVNPISGNTYLSVARGAGPEAAAVIVRVDRSGKPSQFELKGVRCATTTLPNAIEGKSRQEAITQMGYAKGTLYVAGLSNEEFASKLRAIPFPFKGADKGTSIEIYHGSHAKLEGKNTDRQTASPIRTFVAYESNGELNLLAAYTCTPLVRIPVSSLKPGEKVKGTTIAELGNRNRPLDMIVYTKGGKDYILMANSSRGVMKIPAEGIDKVEGIKEAKVPDKAGVGYETIASLKGVEQLDRFDKEHAVLLVRAEGGALNLETIELP